MAGLDGRGFTESRMPRLAHYVVPVLCPGGKEPGRIVTETSCPARGQILGTFRPYTAARMTA